MARCAAAVRTLAVASGRAGAVAYDLTQAEQVAFDQAAKALRLPNAKEQAFETLSGVRGLLPDLFGLQGASDGR